MYNLHTVCKSAHVNGALEKHFNTRNYFLLLKTIFSILEIHCEILEIHFNKLSIRNSFSNIENVLSNIKNEFLLICIHIGSPGMPSWTIICIL